MSVAVLERAAETASGGAPARQAVIRWAWRLFRREWRQQFLVLTLVAVAVAATILGAAVATNTPPPANAGFGTADHLVTVPGDDPHLAATIATIRRHFGAVDVVENRTLATGLADGATIRAQDPRGAYGSSMLAVMTGRFPSTPGEVALTRQLAATFGVHVGLVWSDGQKSRRVVGLVENPQNLLDNFALVTPGQLDSPTRVTVLFDATTAGLRAVSFPRGITPVVPASSSGIAPAVIVFAVAIIGLIFVGLVATAGFVVLAQRRLRALGMLSALGATDADVRLVMVANGALVGTLGAIIGAVAGLVTWFAYAPSLATSVHHIVSPTNMPWWLVASTVLLAVATATLASRRPARAVTRVPVVAALSGRPPEVRAVHRSAVPGAVTLGLAIALLAFSGGWGGNSGKDTLFQLIGLLATAVGLLLLAPFTLSLLAVNADRAPVSARIALRDLTRYRARSGAALAATSFAVFIAVMVTLITTGRYADPVDYFGPNLPANQLLLNASAGGNRGLAGSSNPPPSVAVQQADAEAIAKLLGTNDVLTLDSTDAFLGQRTTTGSRGGPGTIYVASPGVLEHYAINPASIGPTTMLLTSRPGLRGMADLELFGGSGPDPQAYANPTIHTVPSLPTEASAPNLLVTEYAVAKLKLQVSSGSTRLIQTSAPLTDSQINAARQIAATAGLTIETRSHAPSLATVRNDATYAGVLLVLGILAMTIGLIRSETARDIRVLTATGASSHSRRSITAVTAGALGLLGAVLGTAVAYAATAAFFRSELAQRMAHPPTVDLLILLIGMPVVAATGGWLLAGREPAGIVRQPIE
jgi:putative ABC transport system permease protein